MKLKDIRIGSYIRGYYDEDGERKYRDFKVVNILGRLEEVESEEGEIFHIDDCDGIPLTDITLKSIELEEAGIYCYERKANGYTLRYMKRSGKFKLNIIKDNKITSKFRIYTNHVHHLQNALYDCGLYDLADKLKIEEQ